MPLKTYKDLQHIPGSIGLPYFGDFFSYVAGASKFFIKKRKQYGDVFKIRTPFNTSVVLCGPTANKFILIEQSKFTNNQEAWETILSDLFPNGLMLMDGKKHKTHRSIMNEAFKKNPMQGYLEIMPEIISNELDQLKGKEKVLFFPFLKNLTLKVAARVFFGIDAKENLEEVNTAITNIVIASGALPINLPFSNYRKGIKARAYLVDYFKSIIQERRTNPGKDLFSRLCQAKSEEGEQFTDEEIIDHLIFILMAAHDTTAITLSFMSYFIAKNPEWQEAIRLEAKAINMFDNITANDLRAMENTSLVMKETLRIHPPLIVIVRKIEKELEIENYKIPKDTIVNVLLQMTHQDEKVWTSPEKFDPNRFNKERKEQLRCPHSYAPFGAGPHHCVGYGFAEMQVKLVFSELLKRFKLSVPEGYECPIQDVPLKNPKDNLPMYLEAI